MSQIDLDLTTMEGVVALMKSSKTNDEWNVNVDKVKKANNGKYPSFWYATIVLAGVGLAKTESIAINGKAYPIVDGHTENDSCKGN